MESTYKQTLSGSVGAGIGSLFNASGKKYYILEHKTSTLYHKKGESQKIIIDEIELGRDASCQVRFDEACDTVSRHHAAILKDGDGWKLINLSKTNATLVNGQPINKEWHLNSGDEIQLSVRGPIMGFIIPQGAQATVDSIKLSERFTLFRQQALRPYKVATAILSVLVLAALCLSLWALLRPTDVKLLPEPESLEQAMYVNNVYFIHMDDIAIYTPENALLAQFKLDNMGGTGFMLSDGRFVTSRSLIAPWYYFSDPIGKDSKGFDWDLSHVLACVYSDFSVVVNYTAYSPSGANFKFRNTDMIMSDRKDNVEEVHEISKVPKDHQLFRLLQAHNNTIKLSPYKTSDNWATMSKTEQLASVTGFEFDTVGDENLVAGERVAIFGFPFNYGFENSQRVKPYLQYNNINVNGLNDRFQIEMSSKRYQKGFDGAPLLACDKNTGKWRVVGVLSHTDGADRDVATPLSALTDHE
jgi:hypothetical protein